MSVVPSPLLGIGALERLSGIPAETLRTWERRYGFPSPVRTTGGQREYPRETADRLLIIREALARGHRASRVVPTEVASLRALLSLAPGEVAVRSPDRERPSAPGALASPLQDILDGDATRLERTLSVGVLRLGAERWVVELVAPLVTGIGDAWARGDLTVGAEHIATDVLRGLLASTWRPLSEASSGPVAALAGLPDERHELGLHMAAVVLASRGWRVVYLGADTPLDDIVAEGERSDVVAVSCASGCDPDRTRAALREVAERLPTGRVVVGGAGAPKGAGPLELDGLAGLAAWAGAR